MHPVITRRAFLVTAAARLAHPLAAQPPLHPSARPDVASIDHDRILAAATQALTAAPAPITTLKSPLESPPAPQTFYSEADSPSAFTAHRDALLALSRRTSALAAAFQLTRDDRYAAHAALHLRAWFVDPATRMLPDLTHAGTIPHDPKAHFEGVLDTLPLAELAQSIPFLALSSDDLNPLKSWFKAYLLWLAESRLAGLARDQKDHHGTSWLLQTASFARLLNDEPTLADLRHRFKTVTLRAQLVAGGTFPHELATPFPYRNSLFALDLLAASCLLLSTPFESLWDFELQDGPGLRSAIAFHAPFIRNRAAWPYRADLDHFTDLPVRNPSLLFAARAYLRPEYADLWRTLNPDPIPALQPTFPISQPLLWATKPPPRRA